MYLLRYYRIHNKSVLLVAKKKKKKVLLFAKNIRKNKFV